MSFSFNLIAILVFFLLGVATKFTRWSFIIKILSFYRLKLIVLVEELDKLIPV